MQFINFENFIEYGKKINIGDCHKALICGRKYIDIYDNDFEISESSANKKTEKINIAKSLFQILSYMDNKCDSKHKILNVDINVNNNKEVLLLAEEFADFMCDNLAAFA